MNIKNFFTAIILTIAGILTASGQESKCALKLAEIPSMPELRGFHVGMTVEQIKARLPKLQIKSADEFGFAALNIFPDYEPGVDKTAFDGVRTISLEILDGRVYSIWIGYNKSFKWHSLDEFTSGLNTVLKLPDNWRSKFRTRLQDCADFTVAIIPVGENQSIKMTDNAAKELLSKRQAAKVEAQQ